MSCFIFTPNAPVTCTFYGVFWLCLHLVWSEFVIWALNNMKSIGTNNIKNVDERWYCFGEHANVYPKPKKFQVVDVTSFHWTNYTLQSIKCTLSASNIETLKNKIMLVCNKIHHGSRDNVMNHTIQNTHKNTSNEIKLIKLWYDEKP